MLLLLHIVLLYTRCHVLQQNNTDANIFYSLFTFGPKVLKVLASTLNAFFIYTVLRSTTINDTERLSIFRQPPDI